MTAERTDHSLLKKILIRFPMTGKCVARTGHVCITHVHVHLLREMQVWLIENAQSKFRVLQRAAYCWFCSSSAEHKGFGMNKLKAEQATETQSQLIGHCGFVSQVAALCSCTLFAYVPIFAS